MKCLCLKADGFRCSRTASIKVGDAPNFCWQHQKCAAKSKVPLKAKAATTRKTAKPEAPKKAPKTKTTKVKPKAHMPTFPPRSPLYRKVDQLEPSEDCQGNGLHIIPFIMRVVKTQKVKGVCNFKGTIGDKRMRANVAIMFRRTYTPLRLVVPKDFAKHVSECKEKVIVLGLGMIDIGDLGGHSNLIVINKQKKEVERFEPNGEADFYDNKTVDNFVKKNLGTYLKGYKFVGPLEFCPAVGPQYVDQRYVGDCDSRDGFCAVWSTLYGHLRVTSPQASRQEIVAEMFELLKMPYFIQKYLTYIKQTLGKKA